jgi:hypothetical protein
MSIRILFLTVFSLLFELTYSQTKCRIFTQYKNEIKAWAASTIDSLEKKGIDTILFYGVGIPNTGRIAYGKIIWANSGIVNSYEVKSKYFDSAFHLTEPKFSYSRNYEAIQFYFDHRLDTVSTNPKETFSLSHDYLHFVYSTINRSEVCFIAEDYLLRDDTHLRSRWIRLLSDNVEPKALCR